MGDKMTVDLGLKVLTGLLGATWQGREHVQRPKEPANAWQVRRQGPSH